MPKNKDKGEPPKKRGNRSDMVGRRSEQLEAALDAYSTASAAGTTRTWYSKFFEEYWKLFPWEVPLDRDPTEDEIANAPVNDTALTPAQKAAKKKIVNATEAKIKRWFNYQRTHAGGGINPWPRWLKAELKAPEDERRPRRLLDYQVYMQDEEKNAAINAALAEQYPDKVGPRDSIKYRAALARELLAAETEEVQADFKLKGEEEYEEALEEFRKNEGAGAKEEDFDEEARAEARSRLVATIKPVLLSIRKLTGYQVTMLVGAVIDGKVEVKSIHGGTVDGNNEDGPDGVDFTRWDPNGYKPVVKQFMRYIAAANGTPQGVEGGSALAATTNTSASSNPGTAPPPAAPLALPPPSSHPPTMPPPPPSGGELPNTSGSPPPPPARAFSPTPPPCSELVSASAAGPNASGVDGPGRSDDGASMDVDTRAATPERAVTPEVMDPELEGLAVDGPLRRAVMALTPGSRSLRINSLGRMSEWELTRANNMARNNELLSGCGVRDKVAALMADVRKDMKRKPEGEGGGGNKRPRREGAEGDEYTDDGSGSDDDDEERDGTPSPRGKRGSERARGGKGKGKAKKGGRGGRQAAVGDNNVPKWATDTHVTLLAGGGGDLWVKAVDLWWKYEKAASFVGPAKGKGTALRPKEVSGWIARARTGGPVPAIVDVFSFAAKWWSWWKEGEGDWASVASTGPNGMLNILICLRWWCDALGGDEGEMGGWKEALEDVVWALERIWKRRVKEGEESGEYCREIIRHAVRPSLELRAGNFAPGIIPNNPP
ncbi:hypothetical protein B0H16DRAFT_1453125 [Mycena metata]|uniref:Uncharacterized protein n=1 Tax=Mycena metata TaxID=1033252 RepID=A0AAD7NNP4_9AGAR|nr:hypothetical protein B0H16DRAFT_1453125 [Mycena metata]